MYKHFSIPGASCRVPFADLCRRNSEFRTYFIRKTYETSQCIHPQGTKITASITRPSVSGLLTGLWECTTSLPRRPSACPAPS